jgi:hypothetical protein
MVVASRGEGGRGGGLPPHSISPPILVVIQCSNFKGLFSTLEVYSTATWLFQEGVDSP